LGVEATREAEVFGVAVAFFLPGVINDLGGPGVEAALGGPGVAEASLGGPGVVVAAFFCAVAGAFLSVGVEGVFCSRPGVVGAIFFVDWGTLPGNGDGASALRLRNFFLSLSPTGVGGVNVSSASGLNPVRVRVVKGVVEGRDEVKASFFEGVPFASREAPFRLLLLWSVSCGVSESWILRAKGREL